MKPMILQQGEQRGPADGRTRVRERAAQPFHGGQQAQRLPSGVEGRGVGLARHEVHQRRHGGRHTGLARRGNPLEAQAGLARPQRLQDLLGGDLGIAAAAGAEREDAKGLDAEIQGTADVGGERREAGSDLGVVGGHAPERPGGPGFAGLAGGLAQLAHQEVTRLPRAGGALHQGLLRVRAPGGDGRVERGKELLVGLGSDGMGRAQR